MLVSRVSIQHNVGQLRTMTSKAPTAPWREMFLEHITASSEGPVELNLATLHPSSSSSSSSAPSSLSHQSTNISPSSSSSFPFLPRSRTCIFRGMFGSLPPNDKNTAPPNDPGFASDMIALTTDARMAKIPDLFGGAVATAGSMGSGGGGPVEAVFWAARRSTQWRVRGAAYVLAPDLEEEEEHARLREYLLSQMRGPTSSSSSSSSSSSFDFAREITAHFGNLSPVMRGSFKNPPPGTPIPASEPDGGKAKVGNEVMDLHDAEARANFRVVVVVPEEVDQTDLSDPRRPRRWIHQRVAGAGEGEWQKTEVWP